MTSGLRVATELLEATKAAANLLCEQQRELVIAYADLAAAHEQVQALREIVAKAEAYKEAHDDARGDPRYSNTAMRAMYDAQQALFDALAATPPAPEEEHV